MVVDALLRAVGDGVELRDELGHAAHHHAEDDQTGARGATLRELVRADAPK